MALVQQKDEDFANGQMIEVERAVVGLEEYRIHNEYQIYSVLPDR